MSEQYCIEEKRKNNLLSHSFAPFDRRKQELLFDGKQISHFQLA
jgi:hypothetical protein